MGGRSEALMPRKRSGDWMGRGNALNVPVPIRSADASLPCRPGPSGGVALPGSGPCGSPGKRGGKARRNPLGNCRPPRRQPHPTDAGQWHHQPQPGGGGPKAGVAWQQRRWRWELQRRQCHRPARRHPLRHRRSPGDQPQPVDAGQRHHQPRHGGSRPKAGATWISPGNCGRRSPRAAHRPLHGEKR